MNIYSKDYNIYTSKSDGVVPPNYMEDYTLQELCWNVLCETLNRISWL